MAGKEEMYQKLTFGVSMHEHRVDTMPAACDCSLDHAEALASVVVVLVRTVVVVLEAGRVVVVVLVRVVVVLDEAGRVVVVVVLLVVVVEVLVVVVVEDDVLEVVVEVFVVVVVGGADRLCFTAAEEH